MVENIILWSDFSELHDYSCWYGHAFHLYFLSSSPALVFTELIFTTAFSIARLFRNNMDIT